MIPAFGAGHHEITFAKIGLIERKEAADPGPVIVNQAPGLAFGVVIGGTPEEDLAAGAGPIATASTKLEFLEDGFLAEGDEPSPADLSENE